MKPFVLFVAVAAALVFASTPARAVNIAGILETNSMALEVDSVIWQFFYEPGPVPERTPGWGGSVMETDTHQFVNRDDWPLSVRVCFSPRIGGHNIVFFAPVQRNTWYELLDTDNTPRVMFQETSYTAVAEPQPTPTLAELRLGATVMRSGRAMLSADLPVAACRVEVFDAAGREVARQSVTDGRLRLDLADLPAGVYLVRAVSGKDRAAGRLVIIN